MPRKTPIIKIKPEDKAVLEKWVSSRTLPKQTVDRAKMILACETGKHVKLIAQELNTYPNKIIHWRQRYLAKGLIGLQDKNRSGRPAKYDFHFRNSVLDKLKKPPPKGLANWDGPSLAKDLDVPVDAVWKGEVIRTCFLDCRIYRVSACESRKKEPQHLWCRVEKGEKVFQER